jgi:hypothetical protein
VSDELKALLQGLAVGLAFVGTFGFAINSNQWPTLLVLIGVSMVLYLFTRRN